MELVMTFGPEGEIRVAIWKSDDLCVFTGSVLLKTVHPEITKLIMAQAWTTIKFNEKKEE